MGSTRRPSGRRVDQVKAPFEQVVAEHGETILRVCRAVVGPADADDAWQETFLAAMRAYPDLDENANVEAWLVTIAHRKAVDIVRRAARQAVPVADVPDATSPHGVPGATDRDLWNALAQLAPKQRQVLAYHYVAGFGYDEVSELVGGSPEAARRAASDGIRMLRRTYAAGEVSRAVAVDGTERTARMRQRGRA